MPLLVVKGPPHSWARQLRSPCRGHEISLDRVSGDVSTCQVWGFPYPMILCFKLNWLSESWISFMCVDMEVTTWGLKCPP